MLGAPRTIGCMQRACTGAACWKCEGECCRREVGGVLNRAVIETALTTCVHDFTDECVGALLQFDFDAITLRRNAAFNLIAVHLHSIESDDDSIIARKRELNLAIGSGEDLARNVLGADALCEIYRT